MFDENLTDAEWIKGVRSRLKGSMPATELLEFIDLGLSEACDRLEAVNRELGELRPEVEMLRTEAAGGVHDPHDQLEALYAELRDERDAEKARAEAAEAELEVRRKDDEEAAGDLLLPLPEPGSDIAKMFRVRRQLLDRADAAEARVAELEKRVEYLREHDANAYRDGYDEALRSYRHESRMFFPAPPQAASEGGEVRDA